MRAFLLISALAIVGCATEREDPTSSVSQAEFCYDEIYSYCDGEVSVQVCDSGQETHTDCSAYGGTCQNVGSTTTCEYLEPI
jgi:hypothetical protein